MSRPHALKPRLGPVAPLLGVLCGLGAVACVRTVNPPVESRLAQGPTPNSDTLVTAQRPLEAPGPPPPNSLTPSAFARPTPAAPSATVARPPEAAAPRAPSFTRLPLPGFAAPWFWLPPSDGRRLPLLIVAHGAKERAIDHCRQWTPLVGDRAAVLCIVGTITSKVEAQHAEEPRGYFRHHHALAAELSAAIAEVGRAHGEQVDTHQPVYVGYSQGASMGLLAWTTLPMAPRALLLVEGGVRDWTVARTRELREKGLAGVKFLCGRDSCLEEAHRALFVVKRAAVPGEALLAPGAGHTHERQVAARFPELLEFAARLDERWSR